MLATFLDSLNILRYIVIVTCAFVLRNFFTGFFCFAVKLFLNMLDNLVTKYLVKCDIIAQHHPRPAIIDMLFNPLVKPLHNPLSLLAQNALQPPIHYVVKFITDERFIIMLYRTLNSFKAFTISTLPTIFCPFTPPNLPNLFFNLIENLLKFLFILRVTYFKLLTKLRNRRVNRFDSIVKRLLDSTLKLSVKLFFSLLNCAIRTSSLIQLTLLLVKLFQLTTYKTIMSIHIICKPLNLPPQNPQITLHFLIQSLNFQLLNHISNPTLNLRLYTLQILLKAFVHFHNSLQRLSDLRFNMLLSLLRRTQKYRRLIF
ncbi:hypothetical protein BOVATA_008870 [Babesia ovata]|uniref:Uncharacterized protein n=1 Tax=Babesia ovata TaxID=189622 RepID=A0A2H6K8S2_9APIC|nr:uncharacterized protein BOVATA_008870 [Babesia ovata]GBE59394.1 hypothetical protein BOVATA_008870 [Babesia ovata]